MGAKNRSMMQVTKSKITGITDFEKGLDGQKQQLDFKGKKMH